MCHIYIISTSFPSISSCVSPTSPQTHDLFSIIIVQHFFRDKYINFNFPFNRLYWNLSKFEPHGNLLCPAVLWTASLFLSHQIQMPPSPTSSAYNIAGKMSGLFSRLPQQMLFAVLFKACYFTGRLHYCFSSKSECISIHFISFSIWVLRL